MVLYKLKLLLKLLKIRIAFLVIEVAPITLSAASPMSLPTTGTVVLTIDFVVLAMTPSTFAAKLPSSDSIPTKIISNSSNTNMQLFFIITPIFETSTSSEILLTIFKIVEINITY